MNSVDVLIFGRKTFEKILTFDSWPYGSLPVKVVGSQDVKIPDNLLETVTHFRDSPTNLIQTLVTEGYKHAYVDGGKLIQSFLSENLINEITITTIPILIGNGIPLFGSLRQDITLNLVQSRSYDFGLVQSTYQVQKTTD